MKKKTNNGSNRTFKSKNKENDERKVKGDTIKLAEMNEKNISDEKENLSKPSNAVKISPKESIPVQSSL